MPARTRHPAIKHARGHALLPLCALTALSAVRAQVCARGKMQRAGLHLAHGISAAIANPTRPCVDRAIAVQRRLAAATSAARARTCH